MNCKLCGDLTNWSDAYCTRCGLVQDRKLASVRSAPVRRQMRLVFLLCWLSGFSLGLWAGLTVLPALLQWLS